MRDVDKKTARDEVWHGERNTEQGSDFLRRHYPHQVRRVSFPRGKISVCRSPDAPVNAKHRNYFGTVKKDGRFALF